MTPITSGAARALAAVTESGLSTRLGQPDGGFAGGVDQEQGLGERLPKDGPAIPGWTTTSGMTFALYGAHPHRGFPS